MKKIEITEKQTALKEKVVMLMQKKNLTAADLARMTGRSQGTISELLSGKKAYSDNLLNVLADNLKDYIGNETLVATRQYSKMWNIASSGKLAGDMRLVVGNTGIGKSVVFKKFAEENECCFYLKIDRKEMTWNRFLFEVVTEMGIALELKNKDKSKRKRFSSSMLLDKIVLFVEQKADLNPMLIVDESEVARNSFFKEFKNLRTATEGLLNITIVGITEVMARLGKMAGLESREYEVPGSGSFNYRWYPSKTDSNQYTTFARRISVFRIDNISHVDISRFCEDKGICDKKVIEMACQRWWSYDDADRAIKRAERMGIDLRKMGVSVFQLL